MAAKLLLRRDTAANWASSNPVLPQGEEGLATDTEDRKLGDGVTPWNSLAPWSPNVVNTASKLVAIGDNAFNSSILSHATSTAGTSEIMFTVGVAATNVTAMWTHWYTANTSPPCIDTDPAGSIVFSASLRVVSTTSPGTVTNQLYRLTFGGRTTVTLDPGGKTIADSLGISLAVGDVVAIRTYLSSGTAYPPRGTWGVTGWGGFTSTTDLTAPGSASITASVGYYYGPAALLGRQPEGSAVTKSVFSVGDSIGYGVGDAAYYTVPAVSQGGFLFRALTGAAGLLNACIPSDQSSGFQNTNGSFRRLGTAVQCNTAILQSGVNDIWLGASAATLEALNLDIANKLRLQGITKVFLLTLPPHTSSTDGWATTTNQTVIANESARVAYNTWVRASCPIDPSTKAAVAVGTTGALLAGQFGHPFTGIFDTAATVESSLNSGKWAACTRVATGSITSGQSTLTSSDANFLTANQESGGDKGARIVLIGAGAAGAILTANAGVISSGTQVIIDTTAGTTVTNAQLNIGVTTYDGLHPSSRGHHLMAAAINTALL